MWNEGTNKNQSNMLEEAAWRKIKRISPKYLDIRFIIHSESSFTSRR